MVGQYRRPQVDIAKRARIMLAIIMLAGAVLPVFAVPQYDWVGLQPIVRSHTHGFAWELLDRFDHVKFMDPGFRFMALILAPPLIGALVLLIELLRVRRARRAVLLLLMGVVPAALLISLTWERGYFGRIGPLGAVGFLAWTLMAAGIVVSSRRDAHDRGYRLAASAGALGLLMSILPISPGLDGSGDAVGLVTVFKALGVKNGFAVFLYGLVGLAVNVVAVTLFWGGRRRKRAGILAMLILGAVFLAHITLLLIVESGPGGRSYSMFISMLAMQTVRIFPAMCLMAYGISDLILQRIPRAGATDSAAVSG